MCCSFDYGKLRGRIIEKFGSQNAFANAVNTPYQKVSQTLNSKRAMNQREISQWADALDIPVDSYGEYFFKIEVRDSEHPTA